jgi:hypothetical protein
LDDLDSQFQDLFTLHGHGPFDEGPAKRERVWTWEEVLAEAIDPAERDHLEALAKLTQEHPVRISLVAGQVELEAPLSWRAGNPEVYAEACLRLWQFGAEAVRKHLLPRLAGQAGQAAHPPGG